MYKLNKMYQGVSKLSGGYTNLRDKFRSFCDILGERDNREFVKSVLACTFAASVIGVVMWCSIKKNDIDVKSGELEEKLNKIPATGEVRNVYPAPLDKKKLQDPEGFKSDPNRLYVDAHLYENGESVEGSPEEGDLVFWIVNLNPEKK